jgi:PAS domain S-box-containing protein
VLFAFLIDPITALAALGLCGLAGAAVAFALFRSRLTPPETDAAASDGDAASGTKLVNYQLILDTLDRSNVLLWWARVWKDGAEEKWKLRTPPQLSVNPIYRLASLVEEGYLWKDEQSPDHERMRGTADKALAEGASGYQQEFRIVGTDRMHWLSEEVIIRPVGSNEWNLAGVVIDVTNRHEAEDARRLTEVQLDQILKGADCLLWQAVITGDPNTDLHWRMFIPPSVLYKRIFGENADPPGDRLWEEGMILEYKEIQATLRETLRAGKPIYEQEFHATVKGNMFMLHERVKVTVLGPNSWNLVGVIVDITARRNAELALASEKERLAVTLGSMSEGVITIDSTGRVVFINKAAAEITQWKTEETVGRDVSEICVLQNSATGRDVALPVKEVLEGGLHATLAPHTVIRSRSGRLRLVEGRLVPVANLSSERVGAVLVLHDITERQRMEETLQNSAKMESVGILAGGIAHDFNNILTAILSNLTLLQLDLEGMPDEASLVDEAVRATKRAGELTLQLLTFAKGGDPVRTAVHLPEVVKEAATFSHRGSGVKSEFDMPADLWAADVDKAQISQVIQNLVINATQAMPAGGTVRIVASNDRIPVGTHSVLSQGNYIRIAISDTGAGIPPENIAKIFDPYFTTKLHGHGLGLATVFSIVKRHQGHIEVSSTPGKGTTFTFWLPAARVSEIPPSAPVAFSDAVLGGRVLFMDDEGPIVKMAEKLIRRMGLDFEAVGDGNAAIERYRLAKESGHPFDLVVMDLTIPGGMGGKEAIWILREYDPNVKAIVSSGYSSDLAMADFRKHGFRGMVAKPYDISELSAVIRSVLAEK